MKIEKKFNAPIEVVWKAWTDPLLVSNWFGSDPNGKVSKANLDVRPGGLFEVAFTDSDQTEHVCSGTYFEVEKFIKLRFSWKWKSEPDSESFVTVSLAPEGEVTKMKFQHSLSTHASKHDYLKGWNSTFLKLDRMLTSQAANIINGESTQN